MSAAITAFVQGRDQISLSELLVHLGEPDTPVHGARLGPFLRALGFCPKILWNGGKRRSGWVRCSSAT